MPLYDPYSKTVYLPDNMTREQINKIPKVKVSSAGTYHIYDCGLSVYKTKDLEELKKALSKYFTIKNYEELPINVSETLDGTFVLDYTALKLPHATSPHFLTAYLEPLLGHPIAKNQLHHHLKKVLANKEKTFVDFLNDPINSMLETYKTSYLLEGKLYLSLLDVARTKNIKHVTLRARMRAGLDLEEAVNKPFNKKSKFEEKPFTYKGVNYKSYKQFSKKFKLDYADMIKKLNGGKSLDSYLELNDYYNLKPKPIHTINGHSLQLKNYDRTLQFYLDNELSSIPEIDRVIGFENILNKPNIHPFIRKYVKERFKWVNQDGDTFYSLSQIADYYGLSINALSYRVKKKGMSIEDALEDLLNK